MYEQQKTVGTRIGRNAWKRPEVRRLDAGQAEVGTAAAPDVVNTAS